jgi:integrase
MSPRTKLFVLKKSPDTMSSRYYIEGYLSGRRKRFYYKSKSAANKAANDKNREITAFGTQISLDNATRVLAAECLKRLQPFGKSLADAVDFYLDHLKKISGSVTVQEFALAVRSEFARRLEAEEISARHEETMRQALTKLENKFGERPVKSLTGIEIKTWLAGLPRATKTRNKILGYVRGAFSTGKELGLVDIHPLDGISNFTKSGKTTKPPRPLLADEMVRLINGADDRIQPFILIGGFAGLRNEERVNLKWEDVRLEERIIDLSAKISKTGQRRLVPISDNLAKWLKLFVKESGPIIYKSKYTAYDDFRAATLAAGFEQWPENALRDSFCSYRYEQTDDAAKTAKEAGHSIEMLMQNYQQVVTKAETKKFWGIVPNKDGKAQVQELKPDSQS